MFHQMGQLYMTRWPLWRAGDNEVESVAIAWAKKFTGMSLKDVQRGAAAWDGEFPPTAVEFRNFCQSLRPMPNLSDRMRRASEPSESGRNAIKAMREAIRG